MRECEWGKRGGDRIDRLADWMVSIFNTGIFSIRYRELAIYLFWPVPGGRYFLNGGNDYEKRTTVCVGGHDPMYR